MLQILKCFPRAGSHREATSDGFIDQSCRKFELYVKKATAMSNFLNGETHTSEECMSVSVMSHPHS